MAGKAFFMPIFYNKHVSKQLISPLTGKDITPPFDNTNSYVSETLDEQDAIAHYWYIDYKGLDSLHALLEQEKNRTRVLIIKHKAAMDTIGLPTKCGPKIKDIINENRLLIVFVGKDAAGSGLFQPKDPKSSMRIELEEKLLTKDMILKIAINLAEEKTGDYDSALEDSGKWIVDFQNELNHRKTQQPKQIAACIIGGSLSASFIGLALGYGIPEILAGATTSGKVIAFAVMAVLCTGLLAVFSIPAAKAACRMRFLSRQLSSNTTSQAEDNNSTPKPSSK